MTAHIPDPELAPAYQARTAHHHRRPMVGRDPYEKNRAATTLELLFDLTFVVAIGVSSAQFAHALTAGHIAAGVIGASLSIFAVVWAWINFSWFASAFDTDDWQYRVSTMVQMIGVVIVALGIPDVFHSIEAGHGVHIQVMVAGYVVMRMAMVSQWLRAGRTNERYRPICRTYALAISLAQVGWVALVLTPLSLGPTIMIAILLGLVEKAGPFLAELRHHSTPWHPHHIAERYGLFAIIALGEGIVGTVASVSAWVEHGWSVDALVLAVAGVTITFGMWWIYFLFPSGDLLHHHRDLAFRWGYWHLPIFAAIAAVGAVLHVAGSTLEGHSSLGPMGTVTSVAAALGLYIALVYGMYALLVGELDRLYWSMLGSSLTLLAFIVWMAHAGLGIAWALLACATAPVISIVGFEVWGHTKAFTAATTGKPQ